MDNDLKESKIRKFKQSKRTYFWIVLESTANNKRKCGEFAG